MNDWSKGGWEDLSSSEKAESLGLLFGQVLASVGFGIAFGWGVGVGVFGLLTIVLLLIEGRKDR